jgi:hypothetical protein
LKHPECTVAGSATPLLRGSVPVVFADKPPNGIEVFHRLRRESKRRIHPRRFNRSVRRSRNISTAASPIEQFAALGLSEAFLDMGGDRPALFEHPVFQIELLADDLKGLVENLAGVTIRPGADSQVDHALLFRFQVDCHGVSPSE